MSDTTTTVDDLLAHAGWLRALARRLVGDAGAEDLVQEVWLRATKRPPTTLESPRGWLATVARSVYLRQLERRHASQAREREVAPSESLPSTAELTGRAEAQRELVEAVLELDERYRRVVLLRFFEGHSSTEIARRTGESASTVRNHLARGLAELRARLDARPGGRESWMSGLIVLAVPDAGAAGLTSVTLGSLAVWKAVSIAASVALLAWLGNSLFLDDGELAAAGARADATSTELAAPDDRERVASLDPGTDADRREVVVGETPSSTGRAVAGRVVDAAGRPIAGAEVRRAGDAAPSTTDADGRYRFRLDDTSTEKLSLQATAPGHTRIAIALAVPASDDAAELAAIVLDRAVTFRGRVVDANGAPVSGAELRRLPTSGARLERVTADAEGPAEAVSEGDGGFAIAKTPVGPWTLRVDHPSHPTTLVSGDTGPADRPAGPVVLRLDTGGAVAGRVIGAPTEADLLVVATRAAADPGRVEPDLARRVRTSPDGSFRIEGLRPDTDYEIAAVRANDPRAAGVALSDRVLARAGDVDLILRVAAGRPSVSADEAGLRMRVVDGASGEPVERLEIAYRDGLQGLLGTLGGGPIDTDDGWIELDGLRASSPEDGSALRLSAPGYALLEFGGLALERGTWTDLGEVRLDPAPELRVRVVDDGTSEPIADARVALTGYPSRELAPAAFRAESCVACHGGAGRAGEMRRTSTAPGSCLPLYQAKVYRPFTWEAATDDAGVAPVELGSAVPVAAAISHPDFVDVSLDRASYRDGDVLEVRLARGGGALVRVLEADGTPTPGSTVSVDGGEAQVTDARGEARFDALAPGLRTFTASRDAQPTQMVVIGGAAPPVRGTTERVRVRVGETAELTLRLAPANRLTGRVTEGGRPLAGATVVLQSSSSPGATVLTLGAGGPSDDSTRTRSDGSFTLEDVDAGAAELVVTHPGRAMPTRVPLTVRVGESRFDVELSLGIATGVVVDGDGEPIAGAEVSASGPGASAAQSVRFTTQTINPDGTVASTSAAPGPPTVRTDDRGRFELRGLTPEVPLRITAVAPGGRSGSIAVDPLSLDELRGGLRLVLAARGTLRLQVGAGGAFFDAFPRLRLQRLVDGQPAGDPREVRGQGGFAVVDDLTPGEYEVVGYPREGGETEPRVVTVEAGRTRALRVDP